jgi:hypothetical protein
LDDVDVGELVILNLGLDGVFVADDADDFVGGIRGEMLEELVLVCELDADAARNGDRG